MAVVNKRSLLLSVGGTEYNVDVSNVVIAAADAESDFTSYADAAAGGSKDYILKFTARQDTAALSLWDKMWSVSGTTVAVIVKPHGSAAASPTTPHFSGNVVIAAPDGDILGGEADASPTAVQTFEVEWKWTAKPTRLVA